MRIGLYGGTFDPPHRAHLTLAGCAVAAARLDELWFVVARQNPFKPATATDAAIRLQLVQAAVADDPRFRACDIELRADDGRPSYTIDTVRALRRDRPDDTFCLIIGGDSAHSLPLWHESDALRSLVEIWAFARPGFPLPPLADLHPIPAPLIELSATEIRGRVAAGRPFRDLVPPAVATLIRRFGLYRQAD